MGDRGYDADFLDRAVLACGKRLDELRRHAREGQPIQFLKLSFPALIRVDLVFRYYPTFSNLVASSLVVSLSSCDSFSALVL